MVCQRAGVPISVQFRLRVPPERAELLPTDRYLIIRITVNKDRDAGFAVRERTVHNGNDSVSFGNIVVIDGRKWNSKARELRGRDSRTVATNETLSSIKSTIKAIYKHQQKLFTFQRLPKPTVDSVKYEYLTGLMPGFNEDGFIYPASFLARKKNTGSSRQAELTSANRTASLGSHSTVQQVLATYLQEIQDTKQAPGLVSRYYYLSRKHAFGYLANFAARDLQVCQLTPYFLESFHSWLLTRPKGNAAHQAKNKRLTTNTATLYCRHVYEALRWLLKQRLIKTHPLGNFSDLNFPAYKNKEVYVLESLCFERLFALIPSVRLAASHWWVRLICLTGLDYPDAVRYAQARELYEKKTPGGHPKIVIRRAKPPKNECNIPISKKLLDLWNEGMGEAPPPVRYTTFLSHLRELAKLIGFSRPLTPKIGRKTAGDFFLGQYSMHGVSNMLGHSKTTTTEKYYVRVRSYHVDNEMDRTLSSPTGSSPDTHLNSRRTHPFIQVHKSA